jgi:hypothetical protein
MIDELLAATRRRPDRFSAGRSALQPRNFESRLSASKSEELAASKKIDRSLFGVGFWGAHSPSRLEHPTRRRGSLRSGSTRTVARVVGSLGIAPVARLVSVGARLACASLTRSRGAGTFAGAPGARPGNAHRNAPAARARRSRQSSAEPQVSTRKFDRLGRTRPDSAQPTGRARRMGTSLAVDAASSASFRRLSASRSWVWVA